MRKTIKQLETQLEVSRNERNLLLNELRELREKQDKLKRDEMMSFRQENDKLTHLADTLREIIRWQINPETAKYPFQPEKSQIVDKYNR